MDTTVTSWKNLFTRSAGCGDDFEEGEAGVRASMPPEAQGSAVRRTAEPLCKLRSSIGCSIEGLHGKAVEGSNYTDLSIKRKKREGEVRTPFSCTKPLPPKTLVKTWEAEPIDAPRCTADPEAALASTSAYSPIVLT